MQFQRCQAKQLTAFIISAVVVMMMSSIFNLAAHQFSSVAPTSGLVSHSDLDDRAIEALKEFNEEGALQVLLQFKDSDLSHVQVRMRH